MEKYPTSKVREPKQDGRCCERASEGRHTNHNHRKLVNLITWTTALFNSMKLSHAVWGPPKMGRSWWRGLTECGPLEKRMANYVSILALRTPLTV